jgi:hypothetical protein
MKSGRKRKHDSNAITDTYISYYVSEITLRIDPTLNRQVKKVLWAKDFLEF